MVGLPGPAGLETAILPKEQREGDAVRQNSPRGESLPGLLLGAGGMALLAFKSQLSYLMLEGWEAPLLRLALGLLGGGLLGFALAWAYARLLALSGALSRKAAFWTGGWTLAALGLLGWYFYDLIVFKYFNLILPALLAGLVLALAYGAGTALDASPERRRRTALWLGLLCILALGLFLRLSGVNHGLPEFIAHCDTPKQLALVSFFAEGVLTPPDSYPVGHIYLYAGLIRLWQEIAPALATLPTMPLPQLLAPTSDLVLAVRTLQALMGWALILPAFFIARRLWGDWAGLLAALLIALDPVHLTYGRQAMGEIPQTFFVFLSLLCAVRLWQGGGWRDCLLAGLFAGAAAGMKMYGGYIVVAALAAWLWSAPRQVRRPLLILAGLLAGIAAASPHMWVDFAGWLHNVGLQTGTQYGVGQEYQLSGGLSYFWAGLGHRFGLPWLIIALGSLGFLAWRRSRADLFFAVPLALSLIIIFGFRLGYLREWDFVNLTPYLALALAAMICGLAAKIKQAPRGLAYAGSILLAAFLVLQGLIAVGDAWLARQPDTRQTARAWLERYLPPRAVTAISFQWSAFNWLSPDMAPRAVPRNVAAMLVNGQTPRGFEPQALIIERGWQQAPLPADKFAPVQKFALRNQYWENPDISIYLPGVPRYASSLILPHGRAMRTRPVFWQTPWANSRPIDFVLNQKQGYGNLPRHRAMVFPERPLEELGYLALGWGRASLSSGWGLGFPVNTQTGTAVAGVFSPLRSWLPLGTPVYELTLMSSPENHWPPIWVGVFRRPWQMVPLLARYGAWDKLAALTAGAKNGQDAPAEAYLFQAVALAAAGQQEKAKQVLAALNKRHPGFLAGYVKLARGGPGFFANLARLNNANQSMLLSERLDWQRGKGFTGPAAAEDWPAVRIKRAAGAEQIRLPQVFLPGHWQLEAAWKGEGPGQVAGCRLTVTAYAPGIIERQIAGALLVPGQTTARIKLSIPAGPCQLRIAIQGQGKCPALQKIKLIPDLAAEFAWRLQLFRRHLGALSPRLQAAAR